MDQTPKCPWCKTRKFVYPHGHRDFFCGNCKRIFDGIDDGTTGYGDPAKHADRAERREAAEKERRQRR